MGLLSEAPQKGFPIGVALVIDDEPANQDFLVRLLQQTKLDVRGASSGSEALKIADEIGPVSLAVIDFKLSDMNGIELLIQLRERYPKACMIMATMYDERALMDQAFENGCNVFVVKPHGFMELFKRVQTCSDELLGQLIIDQYGPRPFRN